MINNKVIPKGTIAKCKICGNELFRFEEESSHDSVVDCSIWYNLSLNRMCKDIDLCICSKCNAYWNETGLDYYYNGKNLKEC